MNDCPNGDIRDLLPELLHGRLAPAARERVEAHVATCAMCREEFGLLRDLRATLRRAPAIDAAAVAAAIPAYRAPVRRSWTSWRAAAAIVTIAVGGTSVALVSRQTHTPPVVDERSPVADGVRQPQPPVVPNSTTLSPPVAVAPPPGPLTAPVSAPLPEVVAASGRELAMGSGVVTDLSDRELSALLDEIETLDALPSTEVETTLPVSPLAPTGGVR
ncbi:MAG: hypothetical protein JWL95_3023 [Gemmatimonadetes bacterium]|nr:hypothetical protein [Gemmatimonadota bacterium]